jgi:O-antigen ligase
MPNGSADRPWEQRASQWLVMLFPIALLTSLAASEILSVLSLLLAGYAAARSHSRPSLLYARPVNWYPVAAAGVFSFFCLLPLTAEGPLSAAFLDELRSLRWMLFWVALLLVFRCAGSASHGAMLKVLCISIGVLSIYGIVQFWFGIDFSGREGGLHLSGERFRASGTFSLPQSYSGVVGILTFSLLPLGISYLVSGRSSGYLWSMLTPAAVALGVVGVVCSGTRGAYFGMMCTFVIALFMLVLNHELSRRAAFWLLCISVGVATLFLSQLDAGFVEKMMFNSEEPDQSLMIRLPLWEAYIEMIGDRPWFGYGAGISPSYLPAYYELIGASEAEFIGHTHNNYLQAWVDGGLGGFIAYFILIFSMLWISYQRIAKAINREYMLFFIGLFLAQVYFHVFGLTESNFIDIKVNHALIYIWALVLAGDVWVSSDPQSSARGS